jgi:DNA-binding CsgD family transcriptional regulator
MGSERQLAAVTGDIYEAVFDPAGLDRLAQVIARALGCESGFIALLEASPNGRVGKMVGLPSATANFDDRARSSYAEHYHHCNIWFERGSKRGLPAIVLSQELVDDRTLLRSEWYDYCERLDAFHCLGAQFPLDGERMGMFGAHRPRRTGRFEDGERLTMARLMPHLQRALQVQQRVLSGERQRSLALGVLETLGIGVVVTGAAGLLLFANRIAERVLREGSALTVLAGRLQAAAVAARPRLDRMLAEAARTSEGQGAAPGGVVEVAGASGGRLRVLVSPLRAAHLGFGPGRPAALLVFGDPEQRAAAGQALAHGARLTPAETRLLSAILAGQRVSDYARAAGITVGTARIHLKNVLAKTGFHRQIDLVRSVLSGPGGGFYPSW